MKPITVRRRVGIIAKFDQEWEHTSSQAVADYGRLLGRLRGVAALALLQESEGADRDRHFHAALAAVAEGNTAAERLLLQALVPKIISFSRTCRGIIHLRQTVSAEDALCCVVNAAWEAIRTYPLHRVTSVCGNLVLQTLKIITAQYPAPDDRQLSLYRPEDLERLGARPGRQAQDGHLLEDQPMAELLKVLSWSVETRALAPSEARLLGQFTLSSKAEKHELARGMDLTEAQLSKKAYRIRCKLAQAVKEHVLERGALL